MLTRAELEHQTKALWGRSWKADNRRTEDATRAVLGRSVFVWTNLTVRQLFALRAALMVGSDYYLPYPEKVARVRVVAAGTGDFNLKRVPQNPVVIAEDGGEHVVSADILLEDELAAAIASAELAREIEEDS